MPRGILTSTSMGISGGARDRLKGRLVSSKPHAEIKNVEQSNPLARSRNALHANGEVVLSVATSES